MSNPNPAVRNKVVATEQTNTNNSLSNSNNRPQKKVSTNSASKPANVPQKLGYRKPLVDHFSLNDTKLVNSQGRILFEFGEATGPLALTDKVVCSSPNFEAEYWGQEVNTVII